MIDMDDGTAPSQHVHVRIQWLWQAGFILEDAHGFRVALDPYLSDIVQRRWGPARIVPAPVRADELRADVIVFSHWHEDHFDADSVPGFASHSETVFVGPPSCARRLTGQGIAPDRVVSLRVGEARQIGPVAVTAIPAWHDVEGLETPDAIGTLIDFSGVTVYHSGDTEYDHRVRRLLSGMPPTASLICISGTGGCMDAREAALLAAQIGSPVVIPMHYGLWSDEDYGPGATLDPAIFEDTYRRLGGSGTVVVPSVGSPIVVPLPDTLSLGAH